MNQSKLIRPTTFPLPLKQQLNCKPPFSDLNTSSLLRSSSDDLQAFSSFKPLASDLCNHIRQARPLTRNQSSSPTDSGVSVGSYDSSDRTPLTPSIQTSGITPINDGWSSNRFGSSGFGLVDQLKSASNHFGSFDDRSATPHGQFDLFSSTDRLANIWKAPTERRTKNFDPFSSKPATKSTEIRPAVRPLLNSLGKLNEPTRNDLNAAYESDYNWKAPTDAKRGDLDATFVDAKQFGVSVEQCDSGCDACRIPATKHCDECSQFDRLLDLAEVIYQANYKDITYSEYPFGLCVSCVSMCVGLV